MQAVESSSLIALATVFLLAVAACLAVWTWVAVRASRGVPVVPYEPRRQVPWQGVDLVVAVFVTLAAMNLIPPLIAWLATGVAQGPAEVPMPGQPDAAHAVARLLSSSHSAEVLLVCVLAAVVIAPIAEEFLFRVLLQGWLEAVEKRLRRRIPGLRRLVRGAGPVVLVSAVFARMHFRTATPQVDAARLVYLLSSGALSSGLAVAAVIWWLRVRVGATAADFGWVRQKLLADIGLGLVAFLAIAAPVYLLQLALVAILPSSIAPDPISLFLFALVLGTLYYRTHRIVASVVVHMSLNAASLAMAWLYLGK